MDHPALKHIRYTLVAALGLTGCIEQAPTTAEPALDALLDGPPLDGAQTPDGRPDAPPPEPDRGAPDVSVVGPRDAELDQAVDALPEELPERRFPPPCDGVPIPGAEGLPSGFERCADGSIDRVGPARCLPEAPAGRCPEEAAGAGSCVVDSDCVDGAFGRCRLPPYLGPDGCLCEYGCATDADCGAGRLCACTIAEAPTPGEVARAGRCVPDTCAIGHDCEGERCGLASYYEGCETVSRLGCRARIDECTHNAQCAEADGPGFAECWPAGSGDGSRGFDDIWRCDEAGSVCGRPLRVGARPRLAAYGPRAGWQCAVAVEAVSDARPLAAHWAAIGALEHASVASFARFSLQLMALGAPADLLADCQRAAADEVEHARLAYGIASAFAGHDIGPGPLSLDGITLDVDPATVLREVIIEGCIGETLGALEAAEAARTIADPRIAAACARIAEDELRHAALGWRTARWLLAYHPTLASEASEAFADGMRHHTDGIEASHAIISRHGIAVRPAARRAAMREVIGPLAEALLRG